MVVVMVSVRLGRANVRLVLCYSYSLVKDRLGFRIRLGLGLGLRLGF